MLTVQYNDGGIPRSLELTADSLSDLGPIFRLYDKWLKPEIDKVFAGGGNFAPLADSTMANRAGHLEAKAAKIRSGAMEGVSRKLANEHRKAGKRLIKVSGGFDAKRSARAHRTLARHERVRAAFEGLKAGTLTALPAGAKRLPERLIRAGMRAENKIADFANGVPLGQIANSIATKIDGKAGYLEKYSRIAWAGIHNDGGTAGKGAKIPQRKFLEWTPERIAKLAEIAAAYVADKLKKSA